MITNKEILEWLKRQFPDVPKWGNSAFNKDDEKVICIYNRPNGLVQPKSIGMPAGYAIKSVSLLIHWGKTATPCEEMALKLYDAFNNLSKSGEIGNHSCWILANRLPVILGRDEHGFYEAVLDLDIYIRKE